MYAELLVLPALRIEPERQALPFDQVLEIGICRRQSEIQIFFVIEHTDRCSFVIDGRLRVRPSRILCIYGKRLIRPMAIDLRC